MRYKPSMKGLRKANQALKKTSQETYKGLLLALCNQHGNLSFVPELREKILADNWSEVLETADSLSSQLYGDAASHFAANQFASLIKKYPFRPSDVGTDPKGTAFAKWQKAERLCSRHNARFSFMRTKRSPREDFISRVRAFIKYVIGDEPCLAEVYSRCDFTGGAAIGVHGSVTNVPAKLSADWSVSPSAFLHFYNALVMNPSYYACLCEEKVSEDGISITCWDPEKAWETYRAKVKIAKHNKVDFVPKTAKTDRPIAVEPLGNLFIQTGIYKVFRLRLKRIGIDLSDQSRNQYYARFGSEDWELPTGFCTIDLSSASDSISRELVQLLLPPSWYDLLDQVRSKEWVCSNFGEPLSGKYQKFCSMGNGFCFPLETLIFAAIAHASGAGKPRLDFTVYGDDIIVRKPVFNEVLRNLKYCGFRTNVDKTFGTGPFRESCGSDWYAGLDVRPYTLDHKFDCVRNVYKFLNLARRNERTSAFFAGVFEFMINRIPSDLRCFRPHKGPEDTGIDLPGLEHLVSPLLCFRKETQTWEWYEVLSSPVPDTREYANSVRMADTLRGGGRPVHRRRCKSRIYLYGRLRPSMY